MIIRRFREVFYAEECVNQQVASRVTASAAQKTRKITKVASRSCYSLQYFSARVWKSYYPPLFTLAPARETSVCGHLPQALVLTIL